MEPRKHAGFQAIKASNGFVTSHRYWGQRRGNRSARVRLTDSAGLYLEVTPYGSRRWFWKYRFSGKEKRLALGHYTEAGSKKVAVSLKDAREARDDARKLLRKGTDPAQQRQLDKLTRQAVAGVTFEAVARELHATKHSGWSPRYATRWIERMEKDLFPWIGSLPLRDITAPLLLHTLRRIENRGAHETAHTLRQTAAGFRSKTTAVSCARAGRPCARSPINGGSAARASQSSASAARPSTSCCRCPRARTPEWCDRRRANLPRPNWRTTATSWSCIRTRPTRMCTSACAPRAATASA
jgi:hypothetical protein